MFRKNKKNVKEAAEAKRESEPRINRRSAPSDTRGFWRILGCSIRNKAMLKTVGLRRIGMLISRGVLFAVIVAGAIAGGRLIERHVRTSKSFAIKAITLDGARRLGRDEVLQQARLVMGRNVFDVSPKAAQQALLKHPWIASAKVERRLPGTYRVEISERQAVALLSIDDLYLVADDGTVFKPLTEGDPFDLPIITGIDSDEFVSDRDFRASILADAVGLIDEYGRGGLSRRDKIAEVHIEPDHGVTLYVGGDATEIRLGKPPFESKIRRLKTVLDSLERKKSRALYVYLDNVRRPDRVTVRLR
jgi:cell division protein FtsQ